MASRWFGVGKPASLATICRSVRHTPIEWPRSMLSRFLRRKSSGSPFAGFATGVGLVANPGGPEVVADGDPEEALADVRGADAARRKIGGPNAVSKDFQRSTNSGEP